MLLNLFFSQDMKDKPKKDKDIEKDAKKKAKEVLREMDRDGSESVDFGEFSAW